MNARLRDWAERLEAGASKEEIIDELLNAAEFLEREPLRYDGNGDYYMDGSSCWLLIDNLVTVHVTSDDAQIQVKAFRFGQEDQPDCLGMFFIELEGRKILRSI